MRAQGFVALTAWCLLAASAVPAAGQTLADIARKEEERRKNAPAAGKVYTNKDLGAVPPASAPPPAAPAPGGSSTPDAAAKDGDKPADKAADSGVKKDEAYWKGRMKGAQDAVERNTVLADAMQARINALTTDFVNRDDPAQRGVVQRDRERAVAELERLRKQIAADKKAITDIEEEARRAGVPPGWLR